MIFGLSRYKVLKKMPKNAICAEIGVWKGEFCQKILKITKPRMLHLIDPWLFQDNYPNRLYGGKVAKCQKDMDKIFKSVKGKLERFNNVKIHKGFSDKILSEFPNGYFDWIYIDGDHSYGCVKKDLEFSFMKVKSDGFIAGDDYNWGKSERFPVRRAVQDFITTHQTWWQGLT